MMKKYVLTTPKVYPAFQFIDHKENEKLQDEMKKMFRDNLIQTEKDNQYEVDGSLALLSLNSPNIRISPLQWVVIHGLGQFSIIDPEDFKIAFAEVN